MGRVCKWGSVTPPQAVLSSGAYSKISGRFAASGAVLLQSTTKAGPRASLSICSLLADVSGS